nr:hypothetical protein BaRGS_005562 [Batillaria attramentaria]
MKWAVFLKILQAAVQHGVQTGLFWPHCCTQLLELGALLKDMLCRLVTDAATALCIGGQSELPVHMCIEAVVSGSEP